MMKMHHKPLVSWPFRTLYTFISPHPFLAFSSHYLRSSIRSREVRPKCPLQDHTRGSTRLNVSSLHQKVLLQFLLILLVTGVTEGAKVFHGIRLPQPGVVGRMAQMTCDVDTEQSQMYSKRWYINQDVFYSFVKGNNPEKIDHNFENHDVMLEESDNRTVTLRELKPGMQGNYCCEVMTEGPHFQFHTECAILTLIELPEKVEIFGVKRRYKEGDLLNVTCTARKARPPAEISFYVNGRRIPHDSQYVHHLGESSEGGSPQWELFTSTSLLYLPLSRDHVPRLNLTCRARVLTLTVKNSVKTLVYTYHPVFTNFFSGMVPCCSPTPWLLLIMSLLIVLLICP